MAASTVQVVSCESKVRFDSASDARRSAWRMKQKVYYCRFCGGYHTTSTPATKGYRKRG